MLNVSDRRANIYIRLRPLVQSERQIDPRESIQVLDNFCLVVSNHVLDDKVESLQFKDVYKFDRIMNQKQRNFDIFYQVLANTIEQFLFKNQNYHFIVTGSKTSGKSHSFIGKPSDPGLFLVVMTNLFHQIQNNTKELDQTNKETIKYSLKLGCIFQRNKQFYDLLILSDVSLIQYDSEFIYDNFIPIANMQNFLKIFQVIQKNILIKVPPSAENQGISPFDSSDVQFIIQLCKNKQHWDGTSTEEFTQYIFEIKDQISDKDLQKAQQNNTQLNILVNLNTFTPNSPENINLLNKYKQIQETILKPSISPFDNLDIKLTEVQEKEKQIILCLNLITAQKYADKEHSRIICRNLNRIKDSLQLSYNCLEVFYRERIQIPSIAKSGIIIDMNLMGKTIHSSDLRDVLAQQIHSYQQRDSLILLKEYINFVQESLSKQRQNQMNLNDQIKLFNIFKPDSGEILNHFHKQILMDIVRILSRFFKEHKIISLSNQLGSAKLLTSNLDQLQTQKKNLDNCIQESITKMNPVSESEQVNELDISKFKAQFLKSKNMEVRTKKSYTTRQSLLPVQIKKINAENFSSLNIQSNRQSQNIYFNASQLSQGDQSSIQSIRGHNVTGQPAQKSLSFLDRSIEKLYQEADIKQLNTTLDHKQLVKMVAQNNSSRLSKLAKIQESELPLHQFINYNHLDEVKDYKMSVNKSRILVLPKLYQKLTTQVDESSIKSSFASQKSLFNPKQSFIAQVKSMSELSSIKVEDSSSPKPKHQLGIITSNDYLQSLRKANDLMEFHPKVIKMQP